MNETEMLRVEDVADILGIGRTKAYEMVRRGELPILRVGRLVRVPRAELHRWITERVEPPRAA